MTLWKNVALATALASVAFGSASAQQAQPPAQPQQRPAQAQPQRPAQPQPQRPAQAPAPAPQANPNQPLMVQVKAAPDQPNWTKVCGRDQAQNKEICYTTRDFVSDQGQPVVAVAVYDVKGDAQKIVRFILPLGLLLQPGIRFAVDQGQPTPGVYAICLPNGCFGEAPVNEAFINAAKRGQNLNVSVQNQAAREVTFQIPLADFAKGFDGPPIDPAVLAEQQRQAQEEARKQDELRNQLQNAAPNAVVPVQPPAAGQQPPRQ